MPSHGAHHPDYVEHASRLADALAGATAETVAADLATAALCIDLLVQDRTLRLTTEGHQQLLGALNRVEPIAIENLPVDFTQDMIVSGFRALRNLLRYHHQQPAARAGWGDEIDDCRDRARLFRSQLECAALEERIARRAELRRQAVIDALRSAGQSFYPQADPAELVR